MSYKEGKLHGDFYLADKKYSLFFKGQFDFGRKVGTWEFLKSINQKVAYTKTYTNAVMGTVTSDNVQNKFLDKIDLDYNTIVVDFSRKFDLIGKSAEITVKDQLSMNDYSYITPNELNDTPLSAGLVTVDLRMDYFGDVKEAKVIHSLDYYADNLVLDFVLSARNSRPILLNGIPFCQKILLNAITEEYRLKNSTSSGKNYETFYSLELRE